MGTDKDCVLSPIKTNALKIYQKATSNVKNNVFPLWGNNILSVLCSLLFLIFAVLNIL